MSGIGDIFAGALFLGLLMSGSREPVPTPKGEWHDDVGKSIRNAVKGTLSSYNRALRDCDDSLLNVKYKAESKALEVNFSSKMNELEWYAGKINEVDTERIANDVNQILRG